MAENKTNLSDLGDFFCTVSGDGQIYVPARMCKVMGISPGDSVKFSFRKDGVLFSKDDAASKENRGQGEKDKKDGEKTKEALRK